MLNRIVATTAAVTAIGGLFLGLSFLATPRAGFDTVETGVGSGPASRSDSAVVPDSAVEAGSLAAADMAGFAVAVPLSVAADAMPVAAIASTATEADAIVAEEAPADPVQRRTVSLGRGDTLMELLLESDVPSAEAQQIVTAMRRVHDPRKLRAGQDFTLLFEAAGGAERFLGLEFQPAVERSVTVSRTDAGFSAESVETPLERRLTVAEGAIDFSFDQAAGEAGVPAPIRSVLINQLFSYDVDWQRDIQRGDRFEILYETLTTADGQVARAGGIVFAALTLSGKRLPVYRFEDDSGVVDYFNAKGESIRKALLRTPIDGARLTSGFGMRRHPILGYSKMHKGVDFAAPVGTPIYAAGNGVVEEVGPKGAYGNYVRIRHNNEIATAYAHLSRFGRNIRKGARVGQGDVIGFVGNTGRSTGPHLHYEVMRRGKQVNPLSVDLPTGRTLGGKELKRFRQVVAEIDAQYRQARDGGLALVSAPPVPAAGTSCAKAPGC